MASQQERRENITDEQHNIHLEKTIDPKRGAVKVQVGTDFHLAGGGIIHVTDAATASENKGQVQRENQSSFGHNQKQQHGFEERPGGVKFEVNSQKQKGSLDSKHKSQMENSSEERYDKAKELGGSALHNVKESASYGLGSPGQKANSRFKFNSRFKILTSLKV